MSRVKSPSAFGELSTEHARKQLETLTKQLATLAQDWKESRRGARDGGECDVVSRPGEAARDAGAVIARGTGGLLGGRNFFWGFSCSMTSAVPASIEDRVMDRGAAAFAIN